MPILAISLSKPNEPPTTPIEPTIEFGIGDDLVGGAGDHVAAGGGGILHEGDHPALLLLRQLADAAEDQVRLHRRAARRIDDQRDRGGVAHGEDALERARDAGHGQAGPQRRRQADHAGKPHHRHHRPVAAETLRDRDAATPAPRAPIRRSRASPVIASLMKST